jgi:hypothetical protein
MENTGLHFQNEMWTEIVMLEISLNAQNFSPVRLPTEGTMYLPACSENEQTAQIQTYSFPDFSMTHIYTQYLLVTR